MMDAVVIVVAVIALAYAIYVNVMIGVRDKRLKAWRLRWEQEEKARRARLSE